MLCDWLEEFNVGIHYVVFLYSQSGLFIIFPKHCDRGSGFVTTLHLKIVVVGNQGCDLCRKLLPKNLLWQIILGSCHKIEENLVTIICGDVTVFRTLVCHCKVP